MNEALVRPMSAAEFPPVLGATSLDAWIYAIEVKPEHRGRGYSRALLVAAERAAASHGATEIGLNVFGPNAVARRLCETSGYEVKSLQMSKPLPADARST
jgi:GNAT superfamily N-acetyltransferase